jgi:hypothetical protein
MRPKASFRPCCTRACSLSCLRAGHVTCLLTSASHATPSPLYCPTPHLVGHPGAMLLAQHSCPSLCAHRTHPPPVAHATRGQPSPPPFQPHPTPHLVGYASAMLFAQLPCQSLCAHQAPVLHTHTGQHTLGPQGRAVGQVTPKHLQACSNTTC